MKNPAKHIDTNLFKASTDAGLLANVFNDIIWDWDMVAREIRYTSNINEPSEYKTIDYKNGYKKWISSIHEEDKDRVWHTFEKNDK